MEINKTMERKEIYEVIDGERDYQDKIWDGTASSKNPSCEKGALDRTIDEFALYIKGYSNDLVQIASHSDDPNKKLDVIRKVAGLCVACMEKHGAVKRVIKK